MPILGIQRARPAFKETDGNAWKRLIMTEFETHPKTNKYDDEELKGIVAEIRNGNVSAYDKLVERFSHPIFNFIYRTLGNIQESEDLVQEVFLAVFRYFHTYQEKYRLSTWIFTIAHRKAVKHLRQRKNSLLSADNDWLRKFRVFKEKLNDSTFGDPRQSESVSSETIGEALDFLPTAYRQVFVLNYIENLSYKEIAEILDISEGSVRMKLYRGRRFLRKKLKA